MLTNCSRSSTARPRSGDVHQESDNLRNGVRYLTTPSTCFQFLPRVDNFGVDVRPPGFRWLDLMPDGSIESEVIWVEVP
jgi:3',5'-cyclic-AMP phosphodiesterase